MRPRSLDEVVGQPQLTEPGRPLRRALEQGALHSMILWGPPGTGKTTLARLLADVAQMEERGVVMTARIHSLLDLPAALAD